MSDIVSGRTGREVDPHELEEFCDGEVKMEGGHTVLLDCLTPDKIRDGVLTVAYKSIRYPNGSAVEVEYWTGEEDKCVAIIRERAERNGLKTYPVRVDDLEADLEEARGLMTRRLMADERSSVIIFMPKVETSVEEERAEAFRELEQLLMPFDDK